MADKRMTPDKLQELMWSFAAHRILTVSSRLGILAAVSLGPRDAESLADDLGLEAGPVGKILKALEALGLLRWEGSGYAIVPDLLPLFSDEEGGLAPFLEHHHRMYEAWAKSLEPWLKGESWPTRRRDPDGTAAFAAAMRANALQIAGRVAPLLELSSVVSLLDVGGGTGTYSRIFAELNPSLRATVMDLPQVADLGRAQVAGTPLEGRVTFRGGDYLERSDYGDDNDMVLFANVLHQEGPQKVRAMIGFAAKSLRPGGRLAIIDFSIDEPGERTVSHVGALFAVNMRSFGDTHSARVFEDWCLAAGLVDFERRDLDPTRWVLTARKGSK